ncbi:MAG: hypothetical protein FWH22_03485 [Fibromonadales bacterium]|nr:hypothetical protein [Fibromonadales bacterium]
MDLQLKAIDYVVDKKKAKNIYFEGNISSYTYADEGTSLYDVLNLYNNKYRLIKDKLIKEMKNIRELEEYIEKTGDIQLGMMVDIVKEYGNKIPGIINTIKEKHVSNEDKENAEMIFSTVHRCKGMEYDTIQIVNDFVSEDELKKFVADIKKDNINYAKLNEEINLLYVAITRTKNSIHIPETLMPVSFAPSKQIHVMKNTKIEDRQISTTQRSIIVERTNSGVAEKSYSVGEIRTRHKGAYMPWTEELDEELIEMHEDGINIRDLAKHFGRTRGAIRSRVKKLELED